MAWIETYNYGRYGYTRGVATREGGVDRNDKLMDTIRGDVVATREGGVDRNLHGSPALPVRRYVATREGGVDRNLTQRQTSRP